MDLTRPPDQTRLQERRVVPGAPSTESLMAPPQSPPVRSFLNMNGLQAPHSMSQSRSCRQKLLRPTPTPLAPAIKDVTGIHRQVRSFAGMVYSIWGFTNGRSQGSKSALPSLIRLRGSSGTSAMAPGFLLQELEAASVAAGFSSHTITDTSVQEIRLPHPAPLVEHMVVLLKLRWFLRLHSACCELDHKVVSLRHLILGLLSVSLQQHSEAESDSIFDYKWLQNVGAHANIKSIVNDVIDQVQSSLGGSWKGFLEFVATCDPLVSLYCSKMDRSTAEVVSNEDLKIALDTVFIAHFFQVPRKGPTGTARLADLFAELKAAGVALPQLLPLGGAAHLHHWAKVRRGTHSDRSGFTLKDLEKFAQLDALLLTVAVELHAPEVMDTTSEFEGKRSVGTAFSPATAGVPAPAPEITGTGTAGGGVAPPSSQVIYSQKPRLKPGIFEAVVTCVQSHNTFPQGLRERLHTIVTEEYHVTESEAMQLASTLVMTADGNRLSKEAIINIMEKERDRIAKFGVERNKEVSHLITPPLLGPPSMEGQAAKYSESPVISRLARSAPTSPLGRTFANSMPDLAIGSPIKGSPSLRQPPFRIWKGGPLSYDQASKTLQSSGYFMRMPPL